MMMSDFRDPAVLLNERFGAGPEPSVVSVPGRVNLIGEHVDYHNLPVLPMAIQRRVRIAFRPRDDRRIRVTSLGYGEREFEWKGPLEPAGSRDWADYLKAAAQAIDGRWDLGRGMDAAIVSDLPAAAGLSSSSALLTGARTGVASGERGARLLRGTDGHPAGGEHFVGTRGGGMDHAAVLAVQIRIRAAGRFAPLSASPVPIPKDWAFLVAHSLTTAEKSGAVRAEYNSRRTAGTRALQRLGFPSYAAAIESHTSEELMALAGDRLEGEEQRCFQHVAGEAFRVRSGVAALRAGDASAFGEALNASHESLRDLLRVSSVGSGCAR